MVQEHWPPSQATDQTDPHSLVASYSLTQLI